MEQLSKKYGCEGREERRKNCRAVRRFLFSFYSTQSLEYVEGLSQGYDEDMMGKRWQTESLM